MAFDPTSQYFYTPQFELAPQWRVLVAAQQQFIAYVSITEIDKINVKVDRWFQPWSEPIVKRLPMSAANEQKFDWFAKATPFPNINAVPGLFIDSTTARGVPIRFPIGLSVINQQTLALLIPATIPPNPPATTAGNGLEDWYATSSATGLVYGIGLAFHIGLTGGTGLQVKPSNTV